MSPRTISNMKKNMEFMTHQPTRKVFLYILVFIVVLYLGYCGIQKIRDITIANRYAEIVEGMSYNKVIQLLGEPDTVRLIDSRELASHQISDRQKAAEVQKSHHSLWLLTYQREIHWFPLLLRSQGGYLLGIYFDESRERVVIVQKASYFTSY